MCWLYTPFGIHCSECLCFLSAFSMSLKHFYSFFICEWHVWAKWWGWLQFSRSRILFMKEFITTIILCAFGLARVHKIYNFLHRHFHASRRAGDSISFLAFFCFSPQYHPTPRCTWTFSNFNFDSPFTKKNRHHMWRHRVVYVVVVKWMWFDFNSFRWRCVACFQFLECGIFGFLCGFDVKKLSQWLQHFSKTWSGKLHWTPHSHHELGLRWISLSIENVLTSLPRYEQQYERISSLNKKSIFSTVLCSSQREIRIDWTYCIPRLSYRLFFISFLPVWYWSDYTFSWWLIICTTSYITHHSIETVRCLFLSRNVRFSEYMNFTHEIISEIKCQSLGLQFNYKI